MNSVFEKAIQYQLIFVPSSELSKSWWELTPGVQRGKVICHPKRNFYFPQGNGRKAKRGRSEPFSALECSLLFLFCGITLM